MGMTKASHTNTWPLLLLSCVGFCFMLETIILHYIYLQYVEPGHLNPCVRNKDHFT